MGGGGGEEGRDGGSRGGLGGKGSGWWRRGEILGNGRKVVMETQINHSREDLQRRPFGDKGAVSAGYVSSVC